ncbi:MAG: hypothetical protein AAFU71_05000 [Cyanobacteria bacterium J06632_22]
MSQRKLPDCVATTEGVVVPGYVVAGHQVASGQANDPRFPRGTLRLQMPVFARLGLDLSGYYPGTINVSIAPYEYAVVQPKVTLRQVKWASDCPAEDFSFLDCALVLDGAEQPVQGLVYYPHPETKPEHFQDPQTLEVLAPLIPGLGYGQAVQLRLPPEQIRVTAANGREWNSMR